MSWQDIIKDDDPTKWMDKYIRERENRQSSRQKIEDKAQKIEQDLSEYYNTGHVSDFLQELQTNLTKSVEKKLLRPVKTETIFDEKNNKLYWFISKYDKDVILEYDIEQDIASPVLVDKKAGTGKAVLKFFGNIITGINIIDDLLFWSDNKGEPKKINIKRSQKVQQ